VKFGLLTARSALLNRIRHTSTVVSDRPSFVLSFRKRPWNLINGLLMNYIEGKGKFFPLLDHAVYYAEVWRSGDIGLYKLNP
jgi:hypothetical protein